MNPSASLELPPPREIVRLSGPLALIGAVPVLLGFHPARSLVLLCLHGLRRRLGPALRIDLPVPADERAVAEFLAQQATRHATAVMVLCYSANPDEPAPGRSVLPHLGLINRCLRELEDHGVPVLDAVLVRGGSAWSYRHHTPADAGHRLPADDDPQLSHLRAAHVGAGRAVLGDRQSIADAVAGPAGDTTSTSAVVDAFERLAVRIAELDYQGTVEVECDIAHARLVTAVDTHRNALARDDAVWADLVAALSLDLVRDAVISWCLERIGDTPVGLFVDIAQWVSDDFAVPVLSVLALVAYRHGDGALANVALDRALTVDPEYRLALLTRDFVVNGVHPTELDALIIDWADHPANAASPSWLRRSTAADAVSDDGQ